MGAEGPKTVDHQTERIEDKSALDTKIERLEKFIIGPLFDALPVEEQKRLSIQLLHMKGYAKALEERIAAIL